MNKQVVYQGKIIEVIQEKVMYGNEERLFESARRSPGTRLIILTPNNKLIITREFRREHNNYDYRLPGGKVFDTLIEYNQALEKGEDISEKAKLAAAKEAREEVGIEAENLELFTVSKCGVTIDWDLYYFVVNNYKKNQSQELETGEDIKVTEVTPSEAIEICLDGRMQEDRSVAVLLKYFHSQDLINIE